MIVLSKNQIIKLHSQLIQETGGTDGIRESVLAAPFQSFSGTDIYPSLQQKAARLGYGLVKNHLFIVRRTFGKYFVHNSSHDVHELVADAIAAKNCGMTCKYADKAIEFFIREGVL